MAGLTTTDVLARAGRAGWQLVSIQPQMQKNPVSPADWRLGPNGAARDSDLMAAVKTAKRVH